MNDGSSGLPFTLTKRNTLRWHSLPHRKEEECLVKKEQSLLKQHLPHQHENLFPQRNYSDPGRWWDKKNYVTLPMHPVIHIFLKEKNGYG